MRIAPRLGAALTAATLAVGGLTLSPTPAHASTSTTQVTVFLKAPQPSALASLAQATGLSRAQRLAQLADLVPGADTHTQVAQALTDAGLQVVHQTSWSITASGPQSSVTGLFGSHPGLPSGVTAATASVDQLRAAQAPLPQVPSALQGLVSAAMPTITALKPFHSSATTTGADYRKAYTDPSTPATGGTAGGLTVATLQLSTWNSSDLSTYAQNHGLPDPVGSAAFAQVPVDGGTTDTSGDLEVDLDQESILSTAPGLHQQMYVAPNSEAGFEDGYASVYDDVTGNKYATHPNQHIAALSVSWGACEGQTGAANIATFEPILQSLVAAGVTIFGSAGDSGIFDCRTLSLPSPLNVIGQLGSVPDVVPDVDYPASSPSVVSVGGTTLSPVGTAASNNGKNWTETAWSCTDPITCESALGTGGTGGGISGSAYDPLDVAGGGGFAGFAAPSWQTTYVKDAPFAGQTKRMVPDIAAVGDPSTGFTLYTSDPSDGPGNVQVGGTSLASPVSAALLTSMLAAHGRTTGVGDIHAGLYRAYAAGVGVRDITSGSNGNALMAGSDPSTSAGPGYDTVSGIGAVLWPAMAPYLIK